MQEKVCFVQPQGDILPNYIPKDNIMCSARSQAGQKVLAPHSPSLVSITSCIVIVIIFFMYSYSYHIVCV